MPIFGLSIEAEHPLNSLEHHNQTIQAGKLDIIGS